MRGTAAHFYQSLNKPFNIFGVERQLFYLSTGLCVLIFFTGHLQLTPTIIAIVLLIILHVFGVTITRRDDQMVAIYRRHILYKKYYAALAGIHAKVPLVRASVPFYQGKRGLV
jgi:type IV secretion system protein TrbD